METRFAKDFLSDLLRGSMIGYFQAVRDEESVKIWVVPSLTVGLLTRVRIQLQTAITYCEPSFFACSITFCATARPISSPASMSLAMVAS